MEEDVMNMNETVPIFLFLSVASIALFPFISDSSGVERTPPRKGSLLKK
jgi:hypothetical protein